MVITLDVINVCCYLILFFVVTRFPNNGRSHESNLAFSTLSYCVGGDLFVYTTFFRCFLSVPHLVDNYAKNVDERGWSIICERTLRSPLISFKSNSCAN